MIGYLPCEEYIGESVVVVYYDRGSKQWISEETTVLDDPYGMVALSVSGPAVGDPYWVGKTFESIMKTLPIREPNKLGKVARISSIVTYLKDSQGGVLEIGDERHSTQHDLVYEDSERFTGKVETIVDGSFGEEQYIKITTTSNEQFRLLALDMNIRTYER